MKYDLKGVFPTEKISLYNCDNMELLRQTPDNYYDLAIVDPPYGIKQDGKSNHSRKGNAKPRLYEDKNWDREIPNKHYFEELIRVSKNQIIFGGNYFVEFLKPSMCWIFWKKNISASFSEGEFCYTSFKTRARCFEYTWNGFRQGPTNQSIQKRIHPTEKPFEIYKFLLNDYAKTGDKILDTHLGSMSIAIACHDMGFELTGTELDKDYFKAGVERVKKHVSQLSLFAPEELTQKNETLFD